MEIIVIKPQVTKLTCSNSFYKIKLSNFKLSLTIITILHSIIVPAGIFHCVTLAHEHHSIHTNIVAHCTEDQPPSMQSRLQLAWQGAHYKVFS